MLLSAPIVLPFLGIVIALVLAYPILFYLLFSFELTEHTITVNSGILFRQYETIDFNKVQAMDQERGPLLMLFGLTEINIWTASADQLTFSVGANALKTRPRPDVRMLLRKDDAQKLKDLAMSSKAPEARPAL